jgi:hypothetical protein
MAISNGRVDVSLLLIEAGVDTARTDYTGRSAWQVFAPIPQLPPTPSSGSLQAAAAGTAVDGVEAPRGAGPAAPAQRSDSPMSMLQLLLEGLREGRAVPVSSRGRKRGHLGGLRRGKGAGSTA